jgi:hypothetical protein
MEENSYSINIKDLSSFEHICFPDSFEEYSDAVGFFLRRKNVFILEDDILEVFKDDPDVQKEMERGNQGMGAVAAFFPKRFVRETIHPKIGGEEHEGVWGWLDLWSDYSITQQEELYDLFFTYKLRQTDLLELDNILNYFFENYKSHNKTDFIRFLKLTLRKHGKRLLQPEQTETINEWMIEQEQERTLSGTPDIKTKGKPKRERDDKITCLNQEQTALLIYCLRETKIIFPDEFLNNKEAGHAFSILTGYSADTIRQNLNKSEVARLATIKNIDAVTKALNDLLKFIENKVKPE